MKLEWMSLPETRKAKKKSQFQEQNIESPLMADLAKLQRLLAKLNPMYVAMHPFQKPAGLVQRLTRIGMVAVLCLGLVNAPLFAADLLQSPTTPTSSTPVISADSTSSTTTTSPTTASTQTTTSSDFLMTGALSPATSTTTTTTTAAVSAAAATTTGKTLYVSATGNNTGDGSTTNPYGTLQYAVSQLHAGDTLHIEAGTYNITTGATFTTSGTTDAHITVVADAGVVLDGTNLYAYTPIFDTSGQSYLDFEGLTVTNARSAVSVTNNSSNILIEGLHTDHNQMAVIIDQGSYVTVRNSVAANSRNGFVANNTSNHLTFENVEAYGSEDIYSGYETLYRNGDGFIMNLGTHDVVFRNILSHDNWDGGIDSKAVNTLIDGAILYSNKNNMKIWADTTIMNTMSFGARILTDDPVSGEGNGLNARTGNITIINSTFFDNGNHDIQVDAQGPASNVTVENSIFYRNISTGNQVDLVGGNFTEKNNIFYWAGKTSSPEFALSSTSKWLDPKFVDSLVSDLPAVNNTTTHTRDNELVKPKIDLHLTSASPAIDGGSLSYPISTTDLDGNTRVNGSSVDLGAYEFGGATVQPDLMGVQNGAIVTGTITVGPNLQKHSDIQRTVYTLNGASSGDVTQSPFFWGGVSGNGTTGFDTTALVNGTYTLNALSYGTAGNYQASVSFTVNNPILSPGGDFTGVTDGSVLSGTVNIGPNLTAHPSVQKASYYLNGSQSGKVYASPFYWGGVSGTGADGFDTTTLPNGSYNLGMIYTDGTGDHSVAVNFNVNNTVADTTAPVISGVASTGVTTSGATINWTTNEAGDSQVQYRAQGATTWLNTALNTSLVTSHSVTLNGLNASTVYEYQVKSKDQAGNLATTATISNFTTSTPIDATAPVISAVNANNMTSSGATVNWTTDESSDSEVQYRVKGTTTWMPTIISTLMATNHSVALSGLNASTVYEYQVKSKDQAGNLATEATMSSFTTAAPASTCTTAICGVAGGQTVSGVLKVQPNLTLNPDIKKVSYFLNGTLSDREYAAPFIWGGNSGFDTTKLADGTYTLSGAYTNATGDHNFSIAFTVKNSAPADTTAPVISAVAATGVTSAGVTIGWTTNEASDSQVQYRVKGTTTWVNTTLNTSLVTSHSVTLAGLNAGTVYEFQVKSKDQAGNLAIAATVSSFTTLVPTVCTTSMCGVTAGQTVGGTIFVQPNSALTPSIKKVSYYLNGTLYERDYTAPFTWGGTTGIDTKKLANGTYTLSGSYTTATGDVNFTVTFTVKN